MAAVAFGLTVLRGVTARAALRTFIEEGEHETTQITRPGHRAAADRCCSRSPSGSISTRCSVPSSPGWCCGGGRAAAAAALEEKLDALGYGFFIPVFFVYSGHDLDLRSIVSAPLRC